jgi:Mycothiol maleylpyruvate isomerase N-terminal domain
LNERSGTRDGLTVALAEVRGPWLDAVDALVADVEALPERDLLGPTRCFGWAVVDLLAHLSAGLGEVLHAVTAPTQAPPTHDAASYWDAFAPPDPDSAEALAAILHGRRRGSATSRPDGVRREFLDVASAVRRATADLDDRPRSIQGDVLTAGDLLATWVVEVVVHHLDLDLSPPPRAALSLTARVVAARASGPLPDGDDVRVVLVGCGREPVPAAWAGLGLPVLG